MDLFKWWNSYKNKKAIAQWKKSLNLCAHELAFNKLYATVNGFLLSQKARQERDLIDYIYGEIDFLSLIALLHHAKPNKHTVFYDLGCGVGKAVVACAMVYPVRKSAGIELLPDLYQGAYRQKKQLSLIPKYVSRAASIEFIRANFLEADFNDATVIFINASTLCRDTWHKLEFIIDSLPCLEYLIITSKQLSSQKFELTIKTKLRVSWGVVDAYLYHKRRTVQGDCGMNG